MRDYYDLWRILKDYEAHLDLQRLLDLVMQKCDLKGVQLKAVQDLFSETLLGIVEKEWEVWLETVISQVPERKVVIADLQQQLSAIWPST